MPRRPVAGGSISQGFGPTDEPLDGPYQGYAHFNKGFDYAVGEGTPVSAVVSGTVVSAGDSGDGWGLSVKIRDANGNTHNYGHLSAINVQPGQQVGEGDSLGAVGSTGNSTGPHLSYDVWDPSGTFIDPTVFLGEDGGSETTTVGGFGMGPRFQVPNDASSSGATPMAYDPQMEQRLRQAAEAAWAGVLDGSVSTSDWLQLQTALDYYTHHGSLDSSEEDAAQRAFDNAIKLGDFQAGEAAAAYGRWKDKRDAAKGLAEGQIDAANARNEMNSKLAGQRFQNSPEPETRTYFAPGYDDAFARWKSELGVGAEPSADRTTYGGPTPPVQSTRPASAAASAAATSAPAYKNGGLTDNGQAFEGRAVRTQQEPLESDAQRTNNFIYGNDRAMFGIHDLGDLKPAMPRSWDDFLLGKDHKLFGVDVGESRLPDIAPRVGSGLASAYDWLVDDPYQKSIKSKVKKFGKLIGLKDGGRNVPEGVYQVGERGLEHIVTPDNQVIPVGAQGPEVALVPQGSDVYPANVPPEQVIIQAKLRELLAQDQQQAPGKQLSEQQARANDPQLQEKVLASLQQAIAAHDAMNPPQTPVLTGTGWKQDPWADWRQLTGVGPDGQPLAAAQGVA